MLRELASTFHSSTQRKSFSKGNKPSSNPKPKTPSYSLHQKSLSTSLFQTISPPHQDQQQPLQSPSSNTIQLPISSLSPHNQSSTSSKLIPLKNGCCGINCTSILFTGFFCNSRFIRSIASFDTLIRLFTHGTYL